MTVQKLRLPGRVCLVPANKAIEQLARQPHGGGAGGIASVIDEISSLAREGALPARLEPDKDRLVIYTQYHAVWLYLTPHRDAYRLGHLARLTFRDQERLAQGALLLHCPSGWHDYPRVKDLPPGLSSYWDHLLRAWRAVAVASAEPAVQALSLPPHHQEYLDLLAEVVEATRDIEIERQRTAPPIPYRRKSSTQEERHSARGVYQFSLLRPTTLTVGAPVYLTDEPELRGRVLRVEDDRVTIRFDGIVDYRRIPAQGALQILPSDRVYRAQLDAIDALRQGQTASPYLLSSLIDRRLRPYQPDTTATPGARLDAGQLAAFQRALTVPDELLVLGPPGTGKTRTIVEIAAACAERQQRLLITSHTNRAVDNVLERLPSRVRAVRVGNEDAMTSHARGLRVETQVESLKQQIKAATEGLASRLAVFASDDAPIKRWRDFLSDKIAGAVADDRAAQEQAAGLERAMVHTHPAIAAQLANTRAVVDRALLSAEVAERDLQLARQRLAGTQARADSGMLAFLFRWHAGHRQRSVDRLEASLPQTRIALAAAESGYAQTQATAEQAAREDPLTRQLAAARDDCIAARERAIEEAKRAAAMMLAALKLAVPVTEDSPVDLAGWQRYAERLGQAEELASRRARLLSDWRVRLAESGEEMHREMVHYADVVAATCIGTATTPLLAGLDFDLAIVDEAGQISTPNLIVPIIRAKRCVLVGDHNQLPPFLDDEVRGWMESLAAAGDTAPAKAREVSDLLRRSAFERHYLSADDQHRVMLTVQRRMPEVLARFVSEAFYSNLLQTDHDGGLLDPIFARPFAMVDTADRPAPERAEQSAQRNEEWGIRGYVNELEARLIAGLVGEYSRWYRDWAVIVPYRAQAGRITELLTRALGDSGAVAECVGTVDSFQGGERDLIVYGFTRSNSRGDVGFLKELRRINVALTRARRQLVLVGDGTTLSRARDENFARLFQSMAAYLRQNGDVRPSREIADRLARLEGERP